MRIHLQDFSGHPFQAQLSRRLAARGHDVRHTWCAQYVSGRGRLGREPGDPDGLAFEGLRVDVTLTRYSPVGRLRFERAYGAMLGKRLAGERPDVTIVCNVPLFAHAVTARMLTERRLPWVFWHQDVYSAAIAAEAARALPAPLSGLAGSYADRVERDLVRNADAVVAIGRPFLEQYRTWAVPTDHVSVIPNWAPVDEITPRPRENGWWPLPAYPTRLLYAGTLGRKHNPQLLIDLLDAVRARGVDAGLTVASEGVGAEAVRATAGGRPDVRVEPFQPASVLPDMLASADVLVAILEPDAALFSIPSKVLSYLAAGRPVLVLAPADNPCAPDVRSAGGMVCDPTPAGVAQAAAWIASLDAADIERLGRHGRAIACERFDADTITDRFEEVLAGVALSSVGAHPRPTAFPPG